MNRFIAACAFLCLSIAAAFPATCPTGFDTITDIPHNIDGSSFSGSITAALNYNTVATPGGATVRESRVKIPVSFGILNPAGPVVGSACLVPGVHTISSAPSTGGSFSSTWYVPTPMTATVNVIGKVVSWTAGQDFSNVQPGNPVLIGAGSYKVGSITSPVSLTLTSTPGDQSGVNFTITSGPYTIPQIELNQATLPVGSVVSGPPGPTGPGASFPTTTNLLSGDGAGGAIDSGASASAGTFSTGPSGYTMTSNGVSAGIKLFPNLTNMDNVTILLPSGTNTGSNLILRNSSDLAATNTGNVRLRLSGDTFSMQSRPPTGTGIAIATQIFGETSGVASLGHWFIDFAGSHKFDLTPTGLTLSAYSTPGIAKFSTGGALGYAGAIDVTGLWTGTCDATSYLRGDGACWTSARRSTSALVATSNALTNFPGLTWDLAAGTAYQLSCGIGISSLSNTRGYQVAWAYSGTISSFSSYSTDAVNISMGGGTGFDITTSTSSPVVFSSYNPALTGTDVISESGTIVTGTAGTLTLQGANSISGTGSTTFSPGIACDVTPEP